MPSTLAEIQATFGNQLRVRVCGILIEDEKILMIKHQNIGARGYLWSPPGGGLQFGETAHQALLREFQEETFLDISIERFLFVNEFLHAPLHAVELFFEVKKRNGTLAKGTDPEMPPDAQMISEVKFMSIDEIQQENPLNLHFLFRNIAKVSVILKKNGYYHSTN